jgi:hypothetical protein
VVEYPAAADAKAMDSPAVRLAAAGGEPIGYTFGFPGVIAPKDPNVCGQASRTPGIEYDVQVGYRVMTRPRDRHGQWGVGMGATGSERERVADFVDDLLRAGSTRADETAPEDTAPDLTVQETR